jgi:hypothetical protein
MLPEVIFRQVVAFFLGFVGNAGLRIAFTDEAATLRIVVGGSTPRRTRPAK